MSIKINRAQKLAIIGNNPQTWFAIINAIPSAVIERCTAKEIAALADAIRQSYVAGWSQGVAESKSSAAATLGKSSTVAKIAAARENGKRGGRPRKIQNA